MLVTSNLRNRDSVDLFKMNVRNGRMTTIEYDIGRAFGLETDSQGNLRLKTLVEEDERGDMTLRRIHYRPTPGAEWKDLIRFDMFNDLATAIAILPDDNTLILSTRRGTDTSAIWSFDMAKGEYIERLVYDPVYDIGPALGGSFGLRFSPRGDRFLGLYYDAARFKSIWFERDLATLQASLDATFPGLTVWLGAPVTTNRSASFMSAGRTTRANTSSTPRRARAAPKASSPFKSVSRGWTPPLWPR